MIHLKGLNSTYKFRRKVKLSNGITTENSTEVGDATDNGLITEVWKAHYEKNVPSA
jgi:hypothetical protein